MPVYDRGYRHWSPSGRRTAPPWWVIARRGIAAPLKRRGFLALLIAAWIPAVVKGALLYFAYRAGGLAKLVPGSWTAADPPAFFAFIKVQSLAVLIVLAITGAHLITRDREENGLALYFARPLTLADYVLGKGLIILIFFLGVTLLPALALTVFGYLATAGAPGLELLLVTPLRLALHCAVMGASLSLVLLALSASGRRTVFVVIAWALLMAGTPGVARIVALFAGPVAYLVDFPAQYQQAGSVLFGAKPPLEYSPAISWLAIALYTGIAWIVLRRRIRPVEVVS
jgi:ABC-2 type transport system permease protein